MKQRTPTAMPPHDHKFMLTKILPYIAAFSVASIVGITVWKFDQAEANRFFTQERTKTQNQLFTIRARLEGVINLRLSLVEGLVAYAATHPNLTQAEFEQFAEALIQKQSGIRNLALSKGTVLSFYYPLAGNEVAIGKDLLKIPAQKAVVEKAINTRKTILAGPINLVQGGVAFVARSPIFITDKITQKSQLWGLAFVAIDQDIFLEKLEF